MMMPQPLWWIAFVAFVLGMLALDLGVFHRKAHSVSIREALGWTATWVVLALLFDFSIYAGWVGAYPTAPLRSQAALEFLTGYLIELSLSVDNVFVFALLFGYFQVTPAYQHRILFWGILGALVMRAAMIMAGITLIERFHFVIYLFGALLIFGGIKMWGGQEIKADPDSNPVLKLIRRLFPVVKQYAGQNFFLRQNGRVAITPLFVVLVTVEWTDLVFAVDSIPAVLAVTRDPFIVFTSNVMAILGLRSLYFTLAHVMERFYALHYGLSIILIFVGLKMLLVDVFRIPTVIALALVATILLLAVFVSILFPQRRARR